MLQKRLIYGLEIFKELNYVCIWFIFLCVQDIEIFFHFYWSFSSLLNTVKDGLSSLMISSLY